MALVDLRNTTLWIYDGGSHSIRVSIGEGTLTYNETDNIEIVKSRGILDTVRQGDDEAIDVSFSFLWDFITGADGTITIEDALKRTNGASAWVSTHDDPDAPYCIDLKIIKESGCGIKGEQIVIPKFNKTQLGHSVKDGTIDAKGKALAVRATATRA